MIRSTSLFKSIALAAIVCAGGASQAAITVYTTQASFLAAVTAPGVDTFTGFNISSPTQGSITRTAGTYGYTGKTSDLYPSTGTGFYGGGTTANPFLSTNISGDSMTFSNFTGGANAAGGNFFASNASGLYTAGSVTVTAFDAGGSQSVTIAPTSATAGSFIGFVSTTGVTSLSVASVIAGTAIWPSVDNLTLATVSAVPEPGTVALLLAGLGIVGLVSRRRA